MGAHYMSEPVHTSETPATGVDAKVFVGDREVTDIARVEAESAASSAEEAIPGAEHLGDPGKQALERMKAERDEARKTAKANAEAAKRLREIEDRDLSELQRVQRDRDELAAKYAELEQERLRTRVAIAKGHPELADKLTGSSEEELAAHADWFIAWRGNVPPTTPRPDPGQGPRPSTPQAEEDAEYARFAEKLFPGHK